MTGLASADARWPTQLPWQIEGLAGIGQDVFVEGVGMRRVGVVKGLPESAQPVAQRQDQIVRAEGRWRV